MRQRTAPTAGNDVVRADPEAVRETGAGERKSFKAGKLGSEISWTQALAYKDGRSKLLNVKLTVPNRNGRTIVVTGDEGEAQSPPDKPDEVSVGKLTGHVKLTTDNGVELLGNEATFNDAEGIVNVPGPVTFTRGRMKGTGTGATYDRNRDVIWILADAHLIVAPDRRRRRRRRRNRAQGRPRPRRQLCKARRQRAPPGGEPQCRGRRDYRLPGRSRRKDPAAGAARAQPHRRHRCQRANHGCAKHRPRVRARRTNAAGVEDDGERGHSASRRRRGSGASHRRQHDRHDDGARRKRGDQLDRSRERPGRSARGGRRAGAAHQVGDAEGRRRERGAAELRLRGRSRLHRKQGGRRQERRCRSTCAVGTTRSSIPSRAWVRCRRRISEATSASSTATSPPRRRAPSTTSIRMSSISRPRPAKRGPGRSSTIRGSPCRH